MSTTLQSGIEAPDRSRTDPLTAELPSEVCAGSDEEAMRKAEDRDQTDYSVSSEHDPPRIHPTGPAAQVSGRLTPTNAHCKQRSSASCERRDRVLRSDQRSSRTGERS